MLQATRPAYRELVEAGVMMPMGWFTKESAFWFTEEGWNRRFEWLENGPNPSTPFHRPADPPRRSLIGNAVFGEAFNACSWLMPCRCSSYSCARSDRAGRGAVARRTAFPPSCRNRLSEGRR